MSDILWDIFIPDHSTNEKQSIISELQSNMDEELKNRITGYDVKIGMEFFKETATLNNELAFTCLVDREKVKEKILNSLSRRIRYDYSIPIKAGDYIKHQFHYNSEPQRIYIVVANPDYNRGYVESYLTECCFSFNIMSKDGTISTYPVYPDDNKIMLKSSSQGEVDLLDTSSTWLVIKDDDTTEMLGNQIKRILIDNQPYDIIGVNRLPSVKGITKVSVRNGVPNPKDNYETGIAYNENFDIPEPPLPPIHTNEIVGSDILSFGYEEVYTIENNTSNDTIWSCDLDKVLFLNVSKTECEIKCDYDKSLLGKSFTLKAVIGASEYSKKISLKNS